MFCGCAIKGSRTKKRMMSESNWTISYEAAKSLTYSQLNVLMVYSKG